MAVVTAPLARSRSSGTALLALAIGHQLDFFLGDAGNLRDRVGRSLPELDPHHPHVGFVRGMARAVGRRGFRWLMGLCLQGAA